MCCSTERAEEGYHRLTFRRRDACSPGCATYAFGRLQWLCSVCRSSEKVTDDWRFAGETPALFAKQSAFGDCQANAAFTLPLSRRRDACALCVAKRLRRLPGCAVFAFGRLPGCAAYAFGRLQWLCSVCRSSEKVTDDWRFAGETPALQAAQRTPSGGCSGCVAFAQSG